MNMWKKYYYKALKNAELYEERMMLKKIVFMMT